MAHLYFQVEVLERFCRDAFRKFGFSEEESRIITDAENLCLIMFHEIADDVLEMTQNDHIPQEADPLEKAEIKKRLKPYIDRLPQYTFLCEKLFEE